MPRPQLASRALPPALVAGALLAALPAIAQRQNVPVVESAAPAWAEQARWSVDTVPQATLGADRPGGWFAGGVYPVRLADGRIVVGDARADEILVYDAQGRPAGQVATSGDGPGQVARLLWVGAFADSIAAVTSLPTRLMVFGPDGRFARQAELRGMAPARTRLDDFDLSLGDVAMFADGSLVGTPQPTWADPQHPDTWNYLHFTTAGRSRGTLTRINRPEDWRRPIYFACWGMIAVGGDRFYTGWNDRFDIAVHRRDGTIAMRLRRPFTPVAVTQEAYERSRSFQTQALEQRLEELRGDNTIAPESRARLVANLERTLTQRRGAPHRDTYPAWDQMVVDSEGNLWVRAYRPPGEVRQVWSVFDRDGRWLGEVETPRGLRVRQIGPDWILGSYFTGEGGGILVRLHKLNKPAG